MQSKSRDLSSVFLGLLAIAVAFVAVSSQSFWMDEAETGLKVLAPTLNGWWYAMRIDHSSNMQLPLYMLWAWAWTRIFGLSEIALRMANIPWFLLGWYSIFHFLRRHPGFRAAVLLLYCIHPFVWFYLDEARPYIMQLAGAILVTGALFSAIEDEERAFGAAWWWVFGAALAILCGAGMLGVLLGAEVVIFLFFHSRFRNSAIRAGLPAMLIFVPIFIFLAFYYAWTIRQRVGASYMRMDWRSVADIGYEYLGFIGLGPGRGELRTGSVAILRHYLIMLLLLATLLATGFILALRRRFGMTWRHFREAFLLTALPVCLTLAFGFFHHNRVLGRHLTPVFPFILAAEGYILFMFWRGGRIVCRAFAVLIVAMFLLSSVELRFVRRHAKDDDRDASAAAAQALREDKTVWWVAPQDGAIFYQLPISQKETPGKALWLTGMPENHTAAPDMIFYSKPDLTDGNGAIRAFITSQHYHQVAAYPSYTVWAK